MEGHLKLREHSLENKMLEKYPRTKEPSNEHFVRISEYILMYSRRRPYQFKEDDFRFKHTNMETKKSCQVTTSLCSLVNYVT